MSDFQNQHVSEAKLAQRRRRLARWQTAILGARLPMRRAAPAPKRRFGSKHGSGNANAVPRSREGKASPCCGRGATVIESVADGPQSATNGKAEAFERCLLRQTG